MFGRAYCIVVLIAGLIATVGCAGGISLPEPASTTSDADDGGTSSGTVTVAAPENITITAGSHQAVIAWDTVDSADSYNIYRGASAGVSTADDKIADATSPYTDAGLRNDTEYYYAVTAVAGGMESSLSSETSASPSFASTPSARVTLSELQAGDVFGQSVGISGDYAIVGAGGEDGGDGDPLPDAGAAYILKRTGGSWEQTAKLASSDLQAGDQFGAHVAISGDYAIVGTFDEDGGPGDPTPSAGAAYIFERTGESWAQTAKLTASDAQTDDGFGGAVAISGDYAIVSAGGEDGGAGDPLADAGAAYVFKRSGDSWSQTQKLTASDMAVADMFGGSVGVSGSYAIVGTSMLAHGLGATGTAYIFKLTDGVWTETQILTASDAQGGDGFGWSSAISGDRAIVGALWENGGPGDPEALAGAAYVFERTGETWNEAGKLTASDAQAGDRLGVSVAISGDYAIAGAIWENGGDGDPLSQAGAAYFFHRTADGWSQTEDLKFTASNANANDWFGISVAIDSGYILVGSLDEPGDDPADPMYQAGAVYIY